MTDKSEEILDLVRKRDQHYKGFYEANRGLLKRNLDRSDEVNPLEDEEWDVILTGRNLTHNITSAVKGLVGWCVKSDDLVDGLLGDCRISSTHVYPLERIAEAPIFDQEEN